MQSGRRDLNPRSRAPEARGMPGFPTSCLFKSAQRESNPHFRHGKAAGCRYIMGAQKCAELSNNKSTGRDSNPRRRITGAVSSPLDDQCLSVGPEGLEPSPGGLRVRCAAANTLIPCSPFLTRREWARRESNPQSDPYKRPALTAPDRRTGHR